MDNPEKLVKTMKTCINTVLKFVANLWKKEFW
jgi:hypothetical protein